MRAGREAPRIGPRGASGSAASRLRRRVWLAAGLLAAASAILLAGLLLRHPAGAMPRPSDVIVALAGSPEREPYARALLERGVAPRLVSTTVDPACVRAGKPPRACPSGVRNTVDEALLMRRALLAEGVKRVMVVTSGYHRLRAAAVFEIAFFGSGVRVQVVTPPGAASGRTHLAEEAWSFVPSIAAAVVGRLSPQLYEWVVRIARPAGGEASRGMTTAAIPSGRSITNPSGKGREALRQISRTR